MYLTHSSHGLDGFFTPHSYIARGETNSISLIIHVFYYPV